MKYLKKYDEGFFDWISNKFKKEDPDENDTDDNKIAKGIIKTIIPSIDPDNIEYVAACKENGYNDSIYVKLGGGSTLYLTKYTNYGNTYYVVKVDDDIIDCNGCEEKDKNGRIIKKNYRKIIFSEMFKKYKDEQARIRYQRISTNVGL